MAGCAALAAGCLPYVPPDSRPDVTLTTPEIASFSLACDADDGEWLLEAAATSWTGGGVLVWTVDGAYAESHGVGSAESAPDGSAETLALDLRIVADWRDASSGGSTPFLCTDDPEGAFFLFDTDGETPVDCLAFGPDPGLWSRIEGAPSCGSRWSPDSGG